MNNNIFEKIDKQSQTLSEVADKLDGVSVEDLYALAKRTWDYKDYQTAQKYYNHISLLRPLEWKAPFCASLCGCLESESVYLWERRPKTVFSYYQATVEYIQNRNTSEDEKRNNIRGATEIVLDVLKEYVRIYAIPENKKSFDESASKFKHELQRTYISIIKLLEKMEEQGTTLFSTVISDLHALLSDYCQKDHSIVISREDFEKYIAPLKLEIIYDENIYEENDPNVEKEIKLKGKCYLVFKDKVLERRLKRRSLISAILLLISIFTANIIPAIIGKNKWILIGLIIVVPIDIVLFIRGIGSRKGIRQNISFYASCWKYRETSDGNVICEKCLTAVKIISSLIVLLCTGGSFFFCIIGIQGIADSIPGFVPVIIVSFIVQLICAFIFYLTDISDYNCNRRFEYLGKTYYFDK